jgi:hypothetical protein
VARQYVVLLLVVPVFAAAILIVRHINFPRVGRRGNGGNRRSGIVRVAMARIVTTSYRYERPPKRKQPAIATARKPGARYATVPDMTPEEHQPRGEAAQALFREMATTPPRHWRSYGADPLPSGKEALQQPLAAFLSWFLRITCDRCGKDRMFSETMRRGRLAV